MRDSFTNTSNSLHLQITRSECGSRGPPAESVRSNRYGVKGPAMRTPKFLGDRSRDGNGRRSTGIAARDRFAAAGCVLLAAGLCLANRTAQGADPVIRIDPTNVSATVVAGQAATASLTIGNIGDGSLDWNVTRTDPQAFRRIGAIDLDDGGIFKSALIDAAGRYAYFGTTVPGEIVKVDLDTGRQAGAVALPDGEIQLWSAVIDPAGTFGYFATNAAPAQLLKIDLATLDQVASTALDGNVRAAIIDPNGTFAYLGTNTTPGMVLKVDLATFQQVAAITLGSGEDKLTSAVVDPVGRFAYFGTNTSPGRVVKIDLDGFTRVGSAALDTGENNLQSAVIDPAGAYAYFGTNTVPGQLVKIDLAAFARVGSAAAGPDEAHFIAGVIDPAGTAAYFSTSAAPAEIVKFDLTTFARSAAITLEDGENFAGTGVMDPSGDYAYFAATSDPVTFASRIVKLGLAGRDCALPAWTSIDPAGGSVAGGGSQSASVAFDASAQDPGSYAAMLCIASNDPAQPLVTVPLAMTVTPRDASLLAFDPPALDFGEVAVGSSSAPQGATLRNIGSADATGLVFSDPAAAGFGVDAGDCGSTLAAGSSCTVDVTFTPTHTGTVSASLQATSVEGASAGLALGGSGVDPSLPPAIEVEPASLAAALEPGETETRDLVIGNSGGSRLDWSVTETDPTGFGRVGAIDLGEGAGVFRSSLMDPAGHYAYFGTTVPGKIVKVDLQSGQPVGSLALPEGEIQLLAAAIDPDGAFGYFATNVAPALLVKVDLANMDQVGVVALDDKVTSAVIDPDGRSIYLGTNGAPASILKIDLAGFEQAGSIALEAGEEKLTSAVIDPDGGFAYFGTNTSPGRIIKIDLANFRRAAALPLESGENQLRSAVIDAAGRYAYFGTNGSPGQLVRIDLADFTRAGVAAANADEEHFTAGVIDPAGAFAYFSTNSAPTSIVKFDLSAFTRVAATPLEENEILVYTGVMDPAGAFAYFASTSDLGTLAAKVVKIGLAGRDCTLPPWANMDPMAGSAAAGDSRTATVAFDAAGRDPGSYAATLCIASNDPARPLVTVPLAMTVTPSGASPVLAFTPANLDFGDVEVGDTSRTRTATLHNTGNAAATGLDFGDLSGSGFTAATGSCGATLAAGSSCVIAVTFSPAAVGPAEATLTAGSAEGVSADLQLAGSGVPPTPPPAIAVTPGTLGATLEPDRTQALSLAIANLGVETLNWRVDDLPGFRRIDRIDLAHTDYVGATAIDPAGRYAYFGGSDNARGDTITKVDLATFEEAGDIQTDGFGSGYASAVVDPAGHYAYFGTYTDPGVIVKIDLSTFQQVASITLQDQEEYFLDAAVMDPAGRYAYFFGYTSGKIIKVDLDTFTVADRLTLPASLSHPITAVVDPDGRYAYAGIFPRFSEPGQILRIDLASFQLAGSVVMTENERPTSSVIDAQGRYAYFGTFGTDDERGQIVRIDTSTFTQAGEITLDEGETDLTSAVIDPSGAFAYFGANTRPGQIVRIDLGAFERAGAITLQGAGEGDLYGEDYPQSAVIDPAGEYAYFGLASFPGRVARIHLPGPDCTLPGWLRIDPMAGSVTAGESETIDVNLNATGLVPGDYDATLCLDSNDPSMPQLAVPIGLTVVPTLPPDRIFGNGFDEAAP